MATPIKFEGVPNFGPHYTPKQILELGAFNGTFFNTISSREGINPDMFMGTNSDLFESAFPQSNINLFGVLVPIRNRTYNTMDTLGKMQDPKGWFQWYCRFYYGRRTSYDLFRVAQWRNEVATLFHYIKTGTGGANQADRIADTTLFKAERQHLLHFGWDSTEDPLNQEIRL